MYVPKSIQMSSIQNRRLFLVSPVPKGMVAQCIIKRDKSWFSRFFPHYDLYLSDGNKYLMSAKRRTANTTSNYLISADKNDMEVKSQNYLGKVRSNFYGTQFNVYDDGYNP
jgi:tubby-related protein 1